MPNTLSVHNPEIVAKTMIKNLDNDSVMLPLVSRSMEAEMAGEGDVVHAVKAGDITVSNYTPGSDFSVQTVTSTEDTLTLDQIKAFQFVIDRTEIALAKNKHDLVKKYTARARVAMAQTLDTHLLGKYSEVDSGNIIGSDAAPIVLTKNNVYEYFVEARKLLAQANTNDNRVAVVDADTEALIAKAPETIHATAMGDSTIRKGFVGKFAGFDIYQSNRIATVSSVKNLMLFNKEMFIDLVLRIPPEDFDTYKPEKQFGTGVKGLMLYGSNSFYPTAGVVLKKAA